MKIATVVVTYNRTELLKRALQSVKNQSRQPDFVYIISNSASGNFISEQNVCA